MSSAPSVSASLEVDQAQLNRLFVQLVRIGEVHGVRFPREVSAPGAAETRAAYWELQYWRKGCVGGPVRIGGVHGVCFPREVGAAGAAWTRVVCCSRCSGRKGMRCGSVCIRGLQGVACRGRWVSVPDASGTRVA